MSRIALDQLTDRALARGHQLLLIHEPLPENGPYRYLDGSPLVGEYEEYVRVTHVSSGAQTLLRCGLRVRVFSRVFRESGMDWFGPHIVGATRFEHEGQTYEVESDCLRTTFDWASQMREKREKKAR